MNTSLQTSHELEFMKRAGSGGSCEALEVPPGPDPFEFMTKSIIYAKGAKLWLVKTL